MNSILTEINAAKESTDPFEFLTDVTRRYGDAVEYSGPLGKTVLLNHPDLIRQVLQSPQFERTSLVKIVLGEGMLASDGESWKQQRRRALPFFNRNAIEQVVPLIQSRTRAMLDRWTEIAQRGESMDVSAEMTELTLTIIIDALFGVDIHDRMGDLGQALDTLLNDLGSMGCTQLNTPLMFSPDDRARFKTALATLDQIVAEIIAKRREMRHAPDNLLAFLLATQEAGANGPLSERELRDEVVTLMIAGHETTSLILSWGWKLLAENQEIEQALHQELDRELAGNVPGIADLERLPLTLMVLREAMRLYPPVWFIARKSMYAGELNGIYIPENVPVIVSPYAIHRHPNYWARPDQFDPQRFAAHASQAKYTYMPFGGGRHLCLGMNLALVEGHMIMAMIAQKFSIRPDAEGPVVPQPAITLRLRGGLPAALVPRNAAGGFA